MNGFISWTLVICPFVLNDRKEATLSSKKRVAVVRRFDDLKPGNQVAAPPGSLRYQQGPNRQASARLGGWTSSRAASGKVCRYEGTRGPIQETCRYTMVLSNGK